MCMRLVCRYSSKTKEHVCEKKLKEDEEERRLYDTTHTQDIEVHSMYTENG